MTLRDILALVATSLDACGVPYMVTGSLAGSYHGVPRATRDVDVVVGPDADALLDLGRALRNEGLYVSDDAIAEAVEHEGMFNAIDPDTGWKVDFIVRKSRPFSRSEFEARREAELLGLRVSVASPEDVIVAKLEWATMADSQRQLRDVAEILRVQGGALDLERVERWVAELGLGEPWAQARTLAGWEEAGR